MNAGDVRRALVRHLDWWSSFVIPEFEGMDVFQITKAGFGVEYEIKVSARDWRNDFDKPKWAVREKDTGYISRFYFVVPGRVCANRADSGLHPALIVVQWGEGWVMPAIKVPSELPTGVGIICVVPTKRGNPYVKEIVTAKRFKVPPIPERTRRAAFDAFYYRFWRLEAEHRRVLTDYRELLASRKAAA